MATFTFIGASKLIAVNAEPGDSAFTPAELYSAWKDWVAAGNAQFLPAFAESVGGNALGGAARLDAYLFLRNDLGWRIRPDARDHTLTVDGNLFGADTGAPLFVAPVAPATVSIVRTLSTRALLIESASTAAPGAGLTISGIPP